MSILLAYSSALQAGDPSVAGLAKELGLVSGNWPVDLVDVVSGQLGDQAVNRAGGHRLIILLDTVEWYLDTRLLLEGRPFVCLVAYHLDGLLPTLRSQATMLDSAIRAIFSTSPGFVSQSSAVVPTAFCWKPSALSDVAAGSRDVLFGSVLPNVLDRDFSQLVLLQRILKANGAEDKLKVFLRADERMRLPETLVPHAELCADDKLYANFGRISYFVPAPRILDMRGGIVPPEFVDAGVAGAQLLLIKHPLFKPLEEAVQPMFTSVKSFEEVIGSILGGNEISTTAIPAELAPPPQRLANQIWAAYQRAGNDKT